jgi:hypothetical protein
VEVRGDKDCNYVSIRRLVVGCEVDDQWRNNTISVNNEHEEAQQDLLAEWRMQHVVVDIQNNFDMHTCIHACGIQ